jgi:hypothetical protein
VVARPDGVCPEERPAGIGRSGVVAVVDPASRHATASVAAVQQAVSTHPVLASGIRLSSRPVSGHLGSSSRGSGGRPAAVQLSGVQLSGVHPCGVQPSGSALVGPDASISPLRRWRWGPGRGGRATLTTGTGGGPVGCQAVDGSIDGRGGRDAGDAAEVALVRGVGGDPDRRVGCGPRRPRLPASDQPGQAGVRSARRGRLRGGHEGQLQREVATAAAWLPSSGWVLDHAVWSPPSLTAGWAAPEGPGEVPAGRGVRPQRGPSPQRALPARCRLRCDLRRWVVGLPGLEPGTSSLSGFSPRARFPRMGPATWANDVPLETAGDR